jgi:hypothetical protein
MPEDRLSIFHIKRDATVNRLLLKCKELLEGHRGDESASVRVRRVIQPHFRKPS